ncbi:MAG: biotin/lipoate A/B protein ligase family protein [Bacteroidota bacterium]
MTWRFLNTGERSGAFNMALDEQLAIDLRAGRGSPTIRLFGWKPWAVSLGFNQSEDDIDNEKCDRDGIDVVRRPTGGRAILHARELTYSVAMFSTGKSVSTVYHQIGCALVRGLRLFGVNAELAKPTRAKPVSTSRGQVPCFASVGRYEICVDGRKLVGSAQRRYGGGSEGDVVLQHGSILIGPEHRKLAEYIVSERGGSSEEMALAMGERTIEIEHIVGGEIELEAMSDCIKRGFEEEWEISLVEEALNEVEAVPAEP